MHPPSLIRISTFCMKKYKNLSYPLSPQQILCSELVNAQANLKSFPVTKPNRWMCHVVAQIFRVIKQHCFLILLLVLKLKVNFLQRSGTEAIRTQIQPSKPKREITKITIRLNTKRTFGQPSEQLFPKRWPLSNRNRTKNSIETHKVKTSPNL